MYVFTEPLRRREDGIQGQFLSVVQLIWIQIPFSYTGCLTVLHSGYKMIIDFF